MSSLFVKKDYPQDVQGTLEFIDTYLATDIKKVFPEENEFDVSFFRDLISQSELIENLNIGFRANDLTLFPYSDLSFLEGQVLTTMAIYEFEGLKFLSVITPFFSPSPLQFVIVPKGMMKALVDSYQLKNESNEDTSHIIGEKHLVLEREVIDFLTNEDLHAFCREKGIRIKKGICLQGDPGTGKTLSLRYIKRKCQEKGIYFRAFEGAKDFIENKDELEKKESSVFVFEDFDAFALERDKGAGPNQLLQVLLNELDGIDILSNIVSIFTTNHIENIDAAMLRPGRIDKVFVFDTPGEAEIKEFFEAYIPDYADLHYDILLCIQSQHDYKPGMAHIKGIVDDINLAYFYKGRVKPTLEEIKSIIIDSLKRKQKFLTSRKMGFSS